MCGRYVLRNPAEALRALFDLPLPAGAAGPRFNIAPTQSVLAIRSGERGAEPAFLSWGLVPSWSKERGATARLINARAESAAEKPAFRVPFRTRRCLVPADGFFEWAPAPSPRGRKRPWLFALAEGRPFAIAAIWESRREPGSPSPFESVAFLTTRANEVVGRVHDRMPVILSPADFGRWLDPAVREPGSLAPLLVPFRAMPMTAEPVGSRVNDPRNDDARCVEPAGTEPDDQS